MRPDESTREHEPEDDALPRPPRLTLNDHERTRLSQAASTLDNARCADLARLTGAELIRMVEQLRGNLDDMVHLLRDLQA